MRTHQYVQLNVQRSSNPWPSLQATGLTTLLCFTLPTVPPDQTVMAQLLTRVGEVAQGQDILGMVKPTHTHKSKTTPVKNIILERE